MGAMGAALVSMVCNVIDRQEGLRGRRSRNCSAVRDAVRDAAPAPDRDGGRGCRRLRQPDGRLQAAEGHRTRTRARRADAIQAGLRRATEVPLDCARVCARSDRAGAPRGRTAAIGASSAMPVSAVLGRQFGGPQRGAQRATSTRPRSRTGISRERAVAEIDKLLAWCALESEAVYALVRKRLES